MTCTIVFVPPSSYCLLTPCIKRLLAVNIFCYSWGFQFCWMTRSLGCWPFDFDVNDTFQSAFFFPSLPLSCTERYWKIAWKMIRKWVMFCTWARRTDTLNFTRNFGRTYKIVYWGQSQIPLRPDNQMNLLSKLPHFQQHTTMCASLYTFRLNFLSMDTSCLTWLVDIPDTSSGSPGTRGCS